MLVNGVKMVFSKKKMLERIESEGYSNILTEDMLKIMDNLDGREVGTNSWCRQVKGEPVYACRGRDGSFIDVNENDCVGLSEWEEELEIENIEW